MNRMICMLLCFVFASSCGTNKNLDDYKSDQISIDNIAAEKFSTDHQQIPNKNYDYSLVYSQIRSFKTLAPTVEFFVYNHKTNQLILEDTLEAGSVRWISDYEIIAQTRGSKTKDASGSRNHSYTFNCKTEEKLENE